MISFELIGFSMKKVTKDNLKFICDEMDDIQLYYQTSSQTHNLDEIF